MADPTYNLKGGFKPTTKRFADLDGPDFFPTPRWATFALIDNEKFKGDIWECACGDGAMSRVLEETGCSVLSSDLYERGYGETGVDFLNTTHTAAPPACYVRGAPVARWRGFRQGFAARNADRF